MNPIDMNSVSPAPKVDIDRKSDGVKVDNPAQQPVAGLGNDTVELTDTANKLGALQAEIASASGVDLAYVEAIRAKIADGSYQIEPDRIADALVQLERELL
tara:strand:- start:490 stop:792 length:303 start_codon:yes stop_codon:yes gene_type:complete